MKRLLHIINEVPLGWLFAAMLATVLLFGVGYWVAAQGGNLVYSFNPESQPGFARLGVLLDRDHVLAGLRRYPTARVGTPSGGS